jgi:hypothetical protein
MGSGRMTGTGGIMSFSQVRHRPTFQGSDFNPRRTLS